MAAKFSSQCVSRSPQHTACTGARGARRQPASPQRRRWRKGILRGGLPPRFRTRARVGASRLSDHKVAATDDAGKDYAEPVQFFARTYLTEGLRDLIDRAVRR